MLNKIAPPPPAPKKYWSIMRWKGVKDVYRCETCGTFRDDVDSIIEHVILHFPLPDQMPLFEKLIKEK